MRIGYQCFWGGFYWSNPRNEWCTNSSNHWRRFRSRDRWYEKYALFLMYKPSMQVKEREGSAFLFPVRGGAFKAPAFVLIQAGNGNHGRRSTGTTWFPKPTDQNPVFSFFRKDWLMPQSWEGRNSRILFTLSDKNLFSLSCLKIFGVIFLFLSCEPSP